MPVLPYIIKGGLHAYSFISDLFSIMQGPNQDSLATLTSATMRNDILSFVTSHHMFARLAPDTYSLKTRFLVTRVGLNKAGFPVEHESLTVWVEDKKQSQASGLRLKEFVIERAPSRHSQADRFSAFSQFPESQSVLDSIQKALDNVRSRSADAVEFICGTKSDSETDMVPLLPLTNDGIIPTAARPPAPPQLNTTDVITSTLAKAFASARSSSQSLSPQYMAEDTISGCKPGTINPANCIRVFEPLGLSLFDVALLTLVVHDHAPIYGLFDNQCYMFANVIFEAIIQLHSIPSTPSTPIPAPQGEDVAPVDGNTIIFPTPGKEGRWSSLLIIDPIVKKTIVTIVISGFKSIREAYLENLA